MPKNRRHSTITLPNERSHSMSILRSKKIFIGSLVLTIGVVLAFVGYRTLEEGRQTSDIGNLYTIIAQIQAKKLDSPDAFHEMLHFNDATLEGFAEVLLESAYLSQALEVGPPKDLPQTKVPKDAFMKGLRGYSRSRLALWQGNSSKALEGLKTAKSHESSNAVLYDAISLLESLAMEKPLTIPKDSNTPEIIKVISAYTQSNPSSETLTAPK